VRALELPSSDPLTSSGGPRRSGQQLFTKLSCSAIFFTCQRRNQQAYASAPCCLIRGPISHDEFSLKS
jgi:hypothetical protein